MEYEIITEKELKKSVSLRAALQLLTPGKRPASLPSTPLLQPGIRLERDKIAPYAELCGFLPAQGVPATWPYVMTFPLQMNFMLRPSFPYSVIGLVFLANSIRQHETLHPGETVSASVKAGHFLKHDKGQAFTLETTVMTNGRVIWESTSTYLKLGMKQPKGKEYRSLPSEPELNNVRENWQLPPDLGRKYARISGDNNPIHTSYLGARLLGFKQPIAHGMWSAARMLSSLLPMSPLSGITVDINFKTPVFLPSSVSALSREQGKLTVFELRDKENVKPHLRGQFQIPA